jgi:hypothetical protein
VAYTCNPSIQKAEAGVEYEVSLGYITKILPKKKKKKERK